jgi:hypothetical protein
LKRCPRDARGARARSVWNIRPDGCPSVVIGTRTNCYHINKILNLISSNICVLDLFRWYLNS